MKRKPEDYALEARGILLKICTLMMHHKIQLSREPDQDWIEILAAHDDIASLINRLSNLVVDQMMERENAVTFPLEDMEQLLEIGARVWEEQIDPKALQIVPRAHLDQFLLDNGVVKDYKEILLFTSGVLSGREIKRNSDIKKSQFMKIVYKCVMRKSVLNIIKFTNIGGASGGSVAFSTGIQRLQRQILYWGIVTKNTAATGTLTDEQKKEGMSDSCKDIITSLQGLKQDKRISEEECHIMLEEL